MTAHRRQPGRSPIRGPSSTVCEWIGGRLMPPWFIHDRAEPYRPWLAIWIEVPAGLVVGHRLVGPEDAEGSVAAALLDAIRQPLLGSPRRPDQLRVADGSLAAEVREAIGNEIPIVVAPTPELDAVVEEMADAVPSFADRSYLADGRIAPSMIDGLFRAAQGLYRIAPWKVVGDTQVLRMDIPALSVEGACVSIIGNLGESLGFIIFPSVEGFEAFLEVAEKKRFKGRRLDLGTGWLSLNYERGADLPVSMRREVAIHAWPVADASAYPQVERRERDGASCPLVERDIRIVAACAASLGAFFVKYRALFERESFEPICESYFNSDDLEVRFTVPYDAFWQFDVDTGPTSRQRASHGGDKRRTSAPEAPSAAAGRDAPPRSRVGRNDPCPCGSGRKYKKCHMALDVKESDSRHDQDPFHGLDSDLVTELVVFARTRFRDEWIRHAESFIDPAQTMQLAVPWSVYGHRIEGKTTLEWFLEEHTRELSREERRWLTAQQAAWLSVWEVTEVERGVGVSLRDLLSGQTRSVRDISASQTLVVRDAVLARVVDCQERSLLCGIHPRPLLPLDAAEVVRRARGRLRRKRDVPVERLRDEAFGRYLICRWEDALTELDIRASVPPSLSNTDGDPFLLTTDHFVIAAGARASVESALAGLDGVVLLTPGEASNVYDFLRVGESPRPGWGNTVIGRAWVSDTALRLETNSLARADALRGRLEAACGKWLARRGREHADPMSSKAPPVKRASTTRAPELKQIELEFKRQHLVEWVDMTVPALGGKTPREAVKTAQGRTQVDALLKQFENQEHRAGSGAALDFSEVRKELQLD